MQVGASAKPRVVIADDEKIIADTLAIILNQTGFEARAVYSGEQALELLYDFRPDMLVSDVMMGGMNGIETAIVARQKLPTCQILLISGHAVTAELLEETREKGHEFQILAKPVHPTDLIEKMRIQLKDASPRYQQLNSRHLQ